MEKTIVISSNFFTMRKYLILISIFLITFCRWGYSQEYNPDNYNVIWNAPSTNSSESMPCGGGDIGLNVWVENGDVLFYIARSGTFDENNELLKLGRVRLQLEPNPFEGKDFSQELKLKEGHVVINGKSNGINAQIDIWVDVFSPSIYVDVSSDNPTTARVFYENWRYKDVELRQNESFGNSYKWAPPEGLVKHKDSIWFDANRIVFYHQNKGETVFDVAVKQQGLESVKEELYNPLENLMFGGILQGKNMEVSGTTKGTYQNANYKGWIIESKRPKKTHEVTLYLQTNQEPDRKVWLNSVIAGLDNSWDKKNVARQKSQLWWEEFWEKSFISINPGAASQNNVDWQVGRNYQLFRYMLACNAFGEYPTKFNGGLFTYDPIFVDSTRAFSPDFRNWGGGTFTAQNQRLVYFPMLKSGDFDMIKPQIEFYMRILKNAELRTKVYWNHNGASFTEQLENFGLPNPSEYGWDRPDSYDKGLQYNAWLEYQWDTSLEICLLILEQYFYFGTDISEYLDFIFSCLTFFDEHYQYLAKQRGSKTFDSEGKLILYPGSACETYKMAYNSTSTIAGLNGVIDKLLLLPDSFVTPNKKNELTGLRKRIPTIEFRDVNGYTCISPAKLWERINNTEAPQLYPVYPWKIFGLGKPGLDTAINTYKYDTDLQEFRGYVSWKQDNIFAARLGLTDEAWKYTSLKLQDSGRRFPAFWGPGFDWVPDHNWGGSGMIGLQEMLLQTVGDSIYLFPAWPKEKNVHFKLHATNNTTVEAKLINGKVEIVNVIPKDRKKDVVICNFSYR